MVFSFLLGISHLTAQINTPAGATIPFGSNTSYPGSVLLPSNLPTSGTYGQAQDAANAYNQWKTDYVEACGTGKYRVKFDNPNETVSEGIAYGMLLAAYAADKDLFDGLWQYYKDNMNNHGVMNWKIGGCSGTIGSGGAADAELDAAMALLIANHQWPNTTSPHNYSSDVTDLINAIKTWEVQPTNANGTYQINNGDNWGFGNDCRNPSYQSPAYYRLYADHIPAQSTFWDNCVNASYTLINNNAHPTTGLVSNWSDPNGNSNSCNGPDEYGWDACRNPWRMAQDIAWFDDADAKNICTKVSAYVNSIGVSNLSGPVPQSGGTSGFHGPTFVSTYALAVMGAGNNQTLLNQVYTETVNVTDPLPYYFGNTLRAVSLFMLTGNFWSPSDIAPSTINAVISATPTTGYAPLNVAFDASASSSMNGGNLTYTWDFGDGSTGTGATATHIYTSAGVYTATVTVSDGTDSDVAAVTITVNAVLPDACFAATPASGEAPLDVSFDASCSTHPTNDNLTYSWDFGDGTSGTGLTTSHTYTTNGVYTATLTVTDSNGATDEFTTTVSVGVVSGDIKLEYRVGNLETFDNRVDPQFRIVNNGTTVVPYSELTIKYWFTREGTQAQNSWIDYAIVGASNMTSTVVAMSSPENDADHYLELGFLPAAGNLNANSNSGHIQSRVSKVDWTNYDETNDYSYDPSKTDYECWDKVTLYRNGVLIWGIEPITPPPAPTCDIPVPTTVDVISGNVVKLNWSVVNNSERYRIRFRPVGGTWVEKLTAGEETFRFLNGLQASTDYQYQLKSLCTSENSVWSSTYTFASLADVCDFPESTSVNITSPTTVDISWPTDIDDVKWRIKYRIPGPTGTAWVTLNPTVPMVSLTDLVTGAEYKYKTKTKCAAAWTNWSGNEYFTIPNSFQDSSVKNGVTKNAIAAYPNPTSDRLNVQWSTERNTIIQLELFNQQGTLVHYQKIAASNGFNQVELNIKDLPTGIYFLRCIKGELLETVRVVKH